MTLQTQPSIEAEMNHQTRHAAALQQTPIAPWRDKLGRTLIMLVAILTIGAFANGLMMMHGAGPDRIWVETWRTFAYIVFAGLFTLLALRPRKSPLI